MAGEDGRRSRQTVAVILVLCSLASSLTCFILRGPRNKVQQDKVVSEAAVMEEKTGSIIFDEKVLNSESGSASAAGNDGFPHVDLDQSGDTEMFEQALQLKDVMAKEAAWRRLNPTLHCGQTKMKLKVMGPEAAALQLDMGNTHPLPLSQVPETCGYSVQQNALGLVLVVPYDGCNVMQENGNYVVPMSWLETPIKVTCPMLPGPNATAASTAPKPAPHPWKRPFPHRPWSLYRHKRQAPQPPFIYHPSSLYYPYLYQYYYMYMRPAPTTAPPTTTVKPDTTTTTKPTTEKPPQMKPPAYPYLYYPFYPYYPYYYPFPNFPVRTTVPPATTTGPSTTLTTTAKTTTPASTTPPATTKTPQKPSYPYFPYFPYYPYYPPPGQQLPENPDNSDIYYYPIIQHFYGKPPYQVTPSQPTQTTTQPPITTAKPGDTAKPTDSSPTTKPTTASAPTTTSAPTAQTTPSSSNYPGPMSPYVSYYNLPFTPYVSYKYSKDGKLPDYQKHMPQAGYKSGLQARAYPHPGFHYWQPVPWFSNSAEEGIPQFDRKKSTA
ncbi:adhesive plaque matrix protein-like [Toxotes jaculatrix]|uniref:adhesive plaque matrix protein-like n=1 Tax=Toxotes jaculatrix TaxID=941984 RepID=UPI001B3A9BF4|nr:adhesive plaque matrix protein-like [Toxotes jaculatrix]